MQAVTETTGPPSAHQGGRLAAIDDHHGRVLVIEEHELTASALRLALSAWGFDVEIISGGEFDRTRRGGGETAATGLRSARHPPRLRRGNGIELIRPLVATGTTVVMLTVERRRPRPAACLRPAWSDWIRKSSDLDQVEAILSDAVAGRAIVGRTERAELLEQLLRRVSGRVLRQSGRFKRLTPREALVLSALADGLTADEIAEQHFVALTTVRSQIRAVSASSRCDRSSRPS